MNCFCDDARQRVNEMRKMLMVSLVATALLALVAAPIAAATPDKTAPSADVLKIGEREYFTKCFACHSLEEGGEHKVGPNLWGVFGAKAGNKTDFVYSPALKKSRIAWSAQTLDKWLTSPATTVPGNLMAFAGLPKEQDRKALIAYLQKMTGGK